MTKALSARAASIALRCASISSSDVKDLFARPSRASASVSDVKSVISQPDCRRTETASCHWPGRRAWPCHLPCRRPRARLARHRQPCRDRRPYPAAPWRRDSSYRPDRPFHRRRAGTSVSRLAKKNLFDDFRHQKEMVFGGRRVLDYVLGNLAVIDDVRALLHFHRHDRSHGFDAFDIYLPQLLDERQHGVQLALQVRNLGFSNGNPREMRDTANGGGVDGHLY